MQCHLKLAKESESIINNSSLKRKESDYNQLTLKLWTAETKTLRELSQKSIAGNWRKMFKSAFLP